MSISSRICGSVWRGDKFFMHQRWLRLKWKHGSSIAVHSCQWFFELPVKPFDLQVRVLSHGKCKQPTRLSDTWNVMQLTFTLRMLASSVLLLLSEVGGYVAFASVHKSLQQEEYRWSMLAGTFVGLELFSYIFQCAFSNSWMVFLRPTSLAGQRWSLSRLGIFMPCFQVWRGRCCFRKRWKW